MLPDQTHYAIELRNTSWFTDEVYELLNKYGIGWVINDTSAFPVQEVITGNLAYIRFHGPTALYASSYNDTQLKVWVEKIQEYRKMIPIAISTTTSAGML